MWRRDQAQAHQICLQRSAVLFLLTLKENYEIIRSALNFAVGQVQQVVAFTVEDIQTSIKECLLSHAHATNVPVELIHSIISTQNTCRCNITKNI